MAQSKYYNDAKYYPITFSFPLDSLSDDITPKIERVFYMKDVVQRGFPEIEFSFLTAAEYQQWLGLLGNT